MSSHIRPSFLTLSDPFYRCRSPRPSATTGRTCASSWRPVWPCWRSWRRRKSNWCAPPRNVHPTPFLAAPSHVEGPLFETRLSVTHASPGRHDQRPLRRGGRHRHPLPQPGAPAPYPPDPFPLSHRLLLCLPILLLTHGVAAPDERGVWVPGPPRGHRRRLPPLAQDILRRAGAGVQNRARGGLPRAPDAPPPRRGRRQRAAVGCRAGAVS